MADYLEKLSEKDVAAFYRRLAASIDSRFNGDSLAAMLLFHWLDGHGEVKVFPSRFVSGLSQVRSYLCQTARPIFLSQKAGPSGRVGGVVPRIRTAIASMQPVDSYSMHLEGNVETPLSIQAKAYMGMSVDNRELDALYALHGFTVVSDVVASTTPRPGNQYEVKFSRWSCYTTDYYHWNPDKHISVPNPDFGSREPGAVASQEKEITVYHKHAIRVEGAGLAKPFQDRSEPWQETDALVVGPTTVKI